MDNIEQTDQKNINVWQSYGCFKLCFGYRGKYFSVCVTNWAGKVFEKWPFWEEFWQRGVLPKLFHSNSLAIYLKITSHFGWSIFLFWVEYLLILGRISTQLFPFRLEYLPLIAESYFWFFGEWSFEQRTNKFCKKRNSCSLLVV